jgi:hypothetical protein
VEIRQRAKLVAEYAIVLMSKHLLSVLRRMRRLLPRHVLAVRTHYGQSGQASGCIRC